MSDEEADAELLELLRASLALNGSGSNVPAGTGVLESAEHIYTNAIDVALDMHGTKTAARTIWDLMQEREYSCKMWSLHELHPKVKDESTVDFIFLMDLLNFCFWADSEDAEDVFAVNYRDRRWTGYWSLVAALQRALDEGMFDLLCMLAGNRQLGALNMDRHHHHNPRVLDE